jgi:hypothetical protein
MGARAETLAKQFEAKAAEMTKTLGQLSHADWKKVTTRRSGRWASPRITWRAPMNPSPAS